MIYRLEFEQCNHCIYWLRLYTINRISTVSYIITTEASFSTSIKLNMSQLSSVNTPTAFNDLAL